MDNKENKELGNTARCIEEAEEHVWNDLGKSNELMLLEQQNKKKLLTARQEPNSFAPSVSVAMDAEVVTSAPTGMISTTDTSNESDGHNIEADVSYRLNSRIVRSKRPSSASGRPFMC